MNMIYMTFIAYIEIAKGIFGLACHYLEHSDTMEKLSIGFLSRTLLNCMVDQQMESDQLLKIGKAIFGSIPSTDTKCWIKKQSGLNHFTKDIKALGA